MDSYSFDFVDIEALPVGQNFLGGIARVNTDFMTTLQKILGDAECQHFGTGQMLRKKLVYGKQYPQIDTPSLESSSPHKVLAVLADSSSLKSSNIRRPSKSVRG